MIDAHSYPDFATHRLIREPFLRQWPGVQSTAEVANAELRLLGGASFERSMADFQAAISRLGFPGGELTAMAQITEDNPKPPPPDHPNSLAQAVQYADSARWASDAVPGHSRAEERKKLHVES